MNTVPSKPAVDPTGLLHHPARLTAVRRTGLLDTPPEESFDRLTALAARLLDVPTTLIALVDEGRDFFKSRYGFPEAFASLREVDGRTFCHYAIASSGPLTVNDATQHAGFRDLESVKQLGVRAYAGVPLVGEDNQPIGSFCAIDYQPRRWSARDVEVLGELAHATMREIRLRASLAETQRALHSREEMMAVVAHDLRTPLNVITMYAQLLGREALPDKSARLVERLRHTADGMGHLIQSLLDIAQIEAGSLVLTRKSLSASSLLRDAADAQHSASVRAGVRLKVTEEPGLPPVLADYERVMRVFSNLLTNAVNSSAGGTVQLCAARSEKGVRFSVTDTGGGIPADELDGLLNRFWQLKVHERRGAGLGLAIAQGLVSAHGGVMDATTRSGEGSEFGFTLPVDG